MWGNVAVTQAYLTLSEVLGHLDLLIGDGQARQNEATALSGSQRSNQHPYETSKNPLLNSRHCSPMPIKTRKWRAI